MEERFGFSVIVGKFYPPHLGHSYLIDTALSRSDRVVVGVVDKKYDFEETLKEVIPTQQRINWLKEMHPRAEIVWMPQPDWLDDRDSPGWAKWTEAMFGKPDAVFTSEDYGITWAEALGCKHVMVDYDRSKYPVSGTVVRQNPYKYWEWMNPIVRAWYVKRVVMLGVESTGKSTLALALAKHYKTVCVPEYGRIFYEGFSQIPNAPEKWVPADLVHIGKIQVEIENFMRRKSGPVMICDTDVFATQLWNWRYYDTFDRELDSLVALNPADLYVVCGAEIPFVQDGTRLDDQSRRMLQQEKTLDELNRRELNYKVVTGSLTERVDQVVQSIDNLRRYDLNL